MNPILVQNHANLSNFYHPFSQVVNSLNFPDPLTVPFSFSHPAELLTPSFWQIVCCQGQLDVAVPRGTQPVP